ncbi:MAG: hypothetical protein ACP5D6_10705, partial [Kosmotogaceae bacterium]
QEFEMTNNKALLPSTLSMIQSDTASKNVITSTIINGSVNKMLLYGALVFLGPLALTAPILGAAAGTIYLNKKFKKQLQLQNGQEIKLKVEYASLPPLVDAMEHGNIVKFITDDKNEEITDYLIIPKNMESNLANYIKSLTKYPKLFLNNEGIYTIRYYNDFIQLKESKGILYTSYLLERPYEEVSLEKLFLAFQKGETTLDLITQGHEVDDIKSNTIKQMLDEYQDQIHEYQKKYDELEEMANHYDAIGNPEYANNCIKKMSQLEQQIRRYKQLSSEYRKKARYRVGDQNPQKEKLRSSVSHAFSDFYKTVKIRKAVELHKHLKRSIEVLNGYIYSPEKSPDDWVLNI